MKTLIFDIETSPNDARVWGYWDQNVLEYLQEWNVLSFGYKWEGERKTHVLGLNQTDGYDPQNPNDYQLVEFLWHLFDEADVVVAHHGDKFDVPKMNAKFLIHGLGPPSPYRTIDTKKVASKYFKFNSNSLNNLGKTLGLGTKVQHTGYQLWADCLRGDEKAWRMMLRYNKQDVVLLEKVYQTMRPFMAVHPATHTDHACTKCGSKNLMKRGVKRTMVSTFQTWRCNKCGGYSRERLSDKTVEKPVLV